MPKYSGNGAHVCGYLYHDASRTQWAVTYFIDILTGAADIFVKVARLIPDRLGYEGHDDTHE